jgi:phage terminase small subunit
MRDRVRSLKRIADVQKQLHNLEEVKYARLQQRMAECRAAQDELSNALSDDDALHGLFMDVTVRRLKSLRQEEAKLVPEIEAQARVVLEHGGRLRNSERLKDDLTVELRRVEEREELERLLEAGFAQTLASSEQDR